MNEKIFLSSHLLYYATNFDFVLGRSNVDPSSQIQAIDCYVCLIALYVYYIQQHTVHSCIVLSSQVFLNVSKGGIQSITHSFFSLQIATMLEGRT